MRVFNVGERMCKCLFLYIVVFNIICYNIVNTYINNVYFYKYECVMVIEFYFKNIWYIKVLLICNDL